MNLSEQDWSVLSRKLDEALDLPEPARLAWVDSLADVTGELRETLRRLLAQGVDRSFLDALPAIGEPPAPAIPSGPRQVGPYNLLRELGSGGMGSVWLAERSDGLLKRPVALKLPHAGQPDLTFLERFNRERDILATLTHPNIARLYDAGLAEGGRPFIALEYIDGLTLTAYCDREKLPVSRRLEVFLAVLAAVQYAHAHMVLHRDLKPGNILVTAAGDVKLLDFGIAKLMTPGETRATELTEAGGRALTLDYASPEQVSGQPMSTASDVYSLGIVLFELLCGARPYAPKRDSKGALEEAILTAPAGRPSQSAADETRAGARSTTPRKLAALLKGDLDTIVAKALKKSPADRYATADAFAQDIGRYLRGEPVLAQPESALYRARKFVLRHKLPVAASAAAVLALAAGLGAALWEARIARNEARTSAAVEQFLADIFRANSSDQANPVQARQSTARQLLDLGAAKVDRELTESPQAKLRLLKTLAGLYLDLGLDDQAVDLGKKHLALARSIYGNRSPAVAGALVDLAAAMHSSQSASQEEGVLREAETLLDRLGDFASPVRAQLDTKLGEYYYGSDLPRATEYAHRAVEVYRSQPPSTDSVEALYEEGVLRNQLAQYVTAESLLNEAVGISKKIAGDPNPALPRIYATLGQSQEASLEFGPAERSLRQALAAARAVNGNDHVDTVQTAMRLGMFLGDASRPREALEMLRLARDTVLKIRGPTDSFHTPQVLLEYGWALSRVGRIEEGLESIAAAVDNRRKNRPGTRFLAVMLEYQARVQIETGDYAGAGKALDEASAILARTGDTADWRNTDYRARLLLAMGRTDDAAPLVAAAVAASGASPIRSLRARALETELALARRDSAGAVAIASAILQQVGASPARSYLKEWEATASLAEGQGYLLSRQAAKALPLLSRTAEVRSETLDPASPALADVRGALAECWAQLGDRARARASLDEALKIAASHPRLGIQHLGPLRDAETMIRANKSH